MRFWLWIVLLVGSVGAVWAQQQPAQTPPAPAESPAPADGLSRDKTFPEDRPGNSATANDDAAKNDAAKNDAAKKNARSLEPPRSDRVRADDLDTGAGESSSKDTQLDLNPPANDAKVHPKSSAAVAEAEAASLSPGGITELHSWDPHKAAKNVEVGDFYFKRKNYHAAEERYREALRYKDNDATATIRLAVCLEKLGILDDARAEYESYLRILPHGPQSSEAQKALARLKTETK
ncbi:MAG: tetratricopeptide repeat protein [Candidatus Sulfotelmatobacter sp.]